MSALRRLASGRTAAVIAVGVLISSVVLAAAFPAVLRIPRKSPGTPVPPPALFSHRTHQTFGCNACHPSLFPQASLSFTHADMREGRFCGRCHDGGIAFTIAGTACARCHVDGR